MNWITRFQSLWHFRESLFLLPRFLLRVLIVLLCCRLQEFPMGGYGMSDAD